MNLRFIISNVLAIALLVLTVGALVFIRDHQVLGAPAVRVVDVPLPDPDGKPITTNSVWLPKYVGSLVGRPGAVTPVEIGTLPKDTTFGKMVYRDKDGFEMHVTVVVMGKDRTSIHKPEFCLEGQGWRNERDEFVEIPLLQPTAYSLPVRRMVSRFQGKNKDGSSIEATGNYVFWFVAEGRLTARHGERMWWMTKDLIADQVLKRWAYISVFSASAASYQEPAYERIKEFIPQLVPLFQTYPDTKTSGLLSQQ